MGAHLDRDGLRVTEETLAQYRHLKAIMDERDATVQRIFTEPVAHAVAEILRRVRDAQGPDRETAIVDGTAAILELIEGGEDVTEVGVTRIDPALDVQCDVCTGPAAVRLERIDMPSQLNGNACWRDAGALLWGLMLTVEDVRPRPRKREGRRRDRAEGADTPEQG